MIIFTRTEIDGVFYYSGNGLSRITRSSGIEYIRMQELINKGEAIIEDAVIAPLEIYETALNDLIYTSGRNHSIYVRPLETGNLDDPNIRGHIFRLEQTPSLTEVLVDDVSGDPKPFNLDELKAALLHMYEHKEALYRTYKSAIA